MDGSDDDRWLRGFGTLEAEASPPLQTPAPSAPEPPPVPGAPPAPEAPSAPDETSSPRSVPGLDEKGQASLERRLSGLAKLDIEAPAVDAVPARVVANKQEIVTEGSALSAVLQRMNGNAAVMMAGGVFTIVLLTYLAIQILSGRHEAAVQADEPKGPSSAQVAFIDKADRLCAKATKKMKSLAIPTDPLQVDSYVRDAKRIGRDLVVGIGRLDRPKARSGLIDRWLRMNRKAMGILDEMGAAARRGDAGSIQRLSLKLQSLSVDANVLAREYGFVDCASSQ